MQYLDVDMVYTVYIYMYMCGYMGLQTYNWIEFNFGDSSKRQGGRMKILSLAASYSWHNSSG